MAVKCTDKKLIEKSVNVFQTHDVDVLFGTNDGQFFFSENQAVTHARSILSKIYRIEREDLPKRSTTKTSK